MMGRDARSLWYLAGHILKESLKNPKLPERFGPAWDENLVALKELVDSHGDHPQFAFAALWKALMAQADLAATKDHTMLLRGFTAGVIGWTGSRNRNGPRLIIGDGVFKTTIDRFGCPILTPGIREALEQLDGGIVVMVNGRNHTVRTDELGYGQILSLDGELADRNLTVTWHMIGSGEGGIMKRGEIIHVVPGMYFNVSDTSNA